MIMAAGRQRRSRSPIVRKKVGNGTSAANQYASRFGTNTQKIVNRP